MILQKQCKPAHSRKHICKPTRADAQTKGLQKSCNFAYTPLQICYFSTLIENCLKGKNINEFKYTIASTTYQLYLLGS